MSKRFDKQIKDFNSDEEKIFAKTFADAEYNESIPTISIGKPKSELSFVIDKANKTNSNIIREYIHSDVLYCGMGVSSYLKLMQDFIPCERTNPHDMGSLYGMKIKCVGIARDEFFYIDSETNKITKVKFEGIQ